MRARARALDDPQLERLRPPHPDLAQRQHRPRRRELRRDLPRPGPRLVALRLHLRAGDAERGAPGGDVAARGARLRARPRGAAARGRARARAADLGPVAAAPPARPRRGTRQVGRGSGRRRVLPAGAFRAVGGRAALAPAARLRPDPAGARAAGHALQRDRVRQPTLPAGVRDVDRGPRGAGARAVGGATAGGAMTRGLALAVAAGFAVRLLYVLVVQHGVGVGGDGLEFHILANQLADGHGYIQPLVVSPTGVATADKPPLYPLLLAIPSLLGWSSLAAHRVLSCLMGAVLVAGVGLLGRRVGGSERVGLIAAWIAALYPLLVVLDGAVRSESLFAPLVAFLLLATYRLVDRPSAGRAVAVGVLLGACVLTRSEAVLLGAFLLVIVGFRLPGGSRFRPIAGAALIALLFVSPWAIRNWAEFDRPLLSTNSGSLVYGANCHTAYYSGLIGTWPCYPRLTVAPGRDEADVSTELRRDGLDYAGDHAGRLPAVAAVRAARSFDFWSPASATRLEAGIGDRDLTTYRIGVGVYYLLLPLAVWGAVILRRRGEPLALLLSLLALVVVVTLLGYGTPRFGVPAEIPIVVLASVAVARVVRA